MSRAMKTIAALIAATSALLPGLGCVPGPRELEGLSCQRTGQCVAGYTCVQGRCIADGTDAGTLDALAADGNHGDGARADSHPRDVAPGDAATGEGGADAVGIFSIVPHMLNVAGGGPFAAAPWISSAFTDQGTQRGDALTVDLGSELGPGFYEHFDSNQGTIVLWLVPYWSIASVPSGDRCLLVVGDFRLCLDTGARSIWVRFDASNRFELSGALAGWTAGSVHFVGLRWNSHAPAGASDVEIFVDAARFASGDIQLVPATPRGPIVIGAAGADGTAAIGGAISGLTIYRRPLADPFGGFDLGHGDEMGAMRSATPRRDPGRITGPWDVLLALPTDGASNYVSDGNGDAWSHPHAASLTGRNGFFADAQATGWSTYDGATATLLTDCSRCAFHRALEVSADFHTGVTLDALVDPGQSYLVRALLSGDGNEWPEIVVASLADGALLTRAQGSTWPDPLRVDQVVAPFDVPTNTYNIRITVRNVVNSTNPFLIHSIELQPTVVANGSLESVQADVSGVLVPHLWTNDDLLPGESAASPTRAHTGWASLALDVAAAGGWKLIHQFPPLLQQEGSFYAVGGFFFWLGGDPPGMPAVNGRLLDQSDPTSKLDLAGQPANLGWQHLKGVGVRHSDWLPNSHSDAIWCGCASFGCRSLMLVDDIYALHLQQVSLVLHPATLADSYEGEWLRVDNHDVVSQAVSQLTASRGSISVRLWMPYPSTIDDRICVGGGVLAFLWGDAGNFISLYPASRGLVLAAYVGGAATSWTHVPVVVDDQPHQYRLDYVLPGRFTLFRDGVQTFQTEPVSTTFSHVPEVVYFGSQLGTYRACAHLVDRDGATFSVP